jgi:histidinol-phosphate/aromatic aminotransferase/cobyric acid decarboxylase-like protein
MLVHEARKQGLFLRDATVMGNALGERAVRVAVKDAATNRRILAILASILEEEAKPLQVIGGYTIKASC